MGQLAFHYRAWCCLHPKPPLSSVAIAIATASAAAATVLVTIANLGPDTSTATPSASVAPQTAQDCSACCAYAPEPWCAWTTAAQLPRLLFCSCSRFIVPSDFTTKHKFKNKILKILRQQNSIKPSVALCKFTAYMSSKPALTIRPFQAIAPDLKLKINRVRIHQPPVPCLGL